MDVVCPSCGNLTPSEELLLEVEGPPLCRSCGAIELVRRGPRRPSISTRRSTTSGSGSFALGCLLGFFCCPSLLGLFIPGWGSNTKKGIVVGFILGVASSFAIQAYRVSHGLPPVPTYGG